MGTLREERAEVEADRRRLRIRLGIAAVAVLAGVTGFGLLAGGRPVPPGQARYVPAGADPVTEALPALAGAVESARGLLFKKPPSVLVLDHADFAKAVAEPLTPGTPPPNRLATTQALGLAHPAGRPDVAGRPAAGTPSGAGVADLEAFYSYRRHQVLLRRDVPFDAFGRVVLVHELVHALADQNFDLLTMTKAAAGDADRLRALTALIEGDATRIELAYLATRPAADQVTVRSRYDYDPALTGYADQDRYFPYTAGRDFVTALAGQGGNQAVDAAFRRPPVATAQIIDSRRYLAGIGPVGVRAPAAAGQRVDAGSIGQFGLAMLVTGGRRLTNVSSASQWAGDAYITVRTGAGFCTYDNVILASTGARDQLYGDLLPYAGNPANRARITKSADRGLRIQACT
jgi:hypothetical protein